MLYTLENEFKLMDLREDILIGGFRVLQRLKTGSGSQGMVYKAVCETACPGIAQQGETVALKVMADIHDENGEEWHLLEKRTRALSRLNHPNVVHYRGCFAIHGTYSDTYVVVQDFLHGETLKDRLERIHGGLDVEEAMRIVVDSVSGLAYTSSKGIIHRDVKPGNIFLCLNEYGAIRAVRLIDFEVATSDRSGSVAATSENLCGSFNYMAPDFVNPEFGGDVRSDVFSMGVVMHEMLAGTMPYRRMNGDAKQSNFAFLSRWTGDNASPIRISSRIRRLLSNADAVISKALARDPAARYASFQEFLKDLETIRFRELRNGDTVYRLMQFIGKGGFGEVYKARIKMTGELVAIKHLLKAEYAERFRKEADVMRKLQDDEGCLVRFIDFLTTVNAAGTSEMFLVMAYLNGMPGNSLRDAIRRANGKRLPTTDVLIAFVRYARGLGTMHSHGKGIFHRDIKPSNLYYPAGHPEIAAIMDFGIARDLGGTVVTTCGSVPGTLDYMPPEIVTKEGNRGDAGMDIYALGLCLYEALSGKMAFPRLPTGTAGYTVFFERANSHSAPVFDDKVVVSNPPLLALLRDMTNPNERRRLKNAFVVADRLAKILWSDSSASATAIRKRPKLTLRTPVYSKFKMRFLKSVAMCKSWFETARSMAHNAIGCVRKAIVSNRNAVVYVRKILKGIPAKAILAASALLILLVVATFAVKAVRSAWRNAQEVPVPAQQNNVPSIADIEDMIRKRIEAEKKRLDMDTAKNAAENEKTVGVAPLAKEAESVSAEKRRLEEECIRLEREIAALKRLKALEDKEPIGADSASAGEDSTKAANRQTDTAKMEFIKKVEKQFGNWFNSLRKQ